MKPLASAQRPMRQVQSWLAQLPYLPDADLIQLAHEIAHEAKRRRGLLTDDPDEPIPTRSTWGDRLLLWSAMGAIVALCWILIATLAYAVGCVLGWW